MISLTGGSTLSTYQPGAAHTLSRTGGGRQGLYVSAGTLSGAGGCSGRDVGGQLFVRLGVLREGALDAIQEKIISRKLLVFGVATGLFAWFGLDPDTWGLIAMIYVGGQSVIDTVKVWKHG